MADPRILLAAIHTRAKKSNEFKACERTEAGLVCAHLSKGVVSYSLDNSILLYPDLLLRIEAAIEMKRIIENH